MKQFHWNHIDQTGKLHKVGLMHGSRTGHVLIHVNGKISSIDFKVMETKQYSFFINEELIELNIIRHDDHYEYTMEINEEVKTPLNERRNKARAKMGYQTFAFFGILMLIVLGFSMWMINSDWYKHRQKEQIRRLDYIGIYTKAKLFVKDGKTYKYSFVDRDLNLVEAKEPLPRYLIQNGDEYMVRYLPSDPSINKVFFAKPTEYQIDRAMKEVLKVCQELDATKSEGMCQCIVEAAAETKGYKGLMSYVNQHVVSAMNPVFNAESANTLLNSDTFKRHLKECLN
jgi:hypothetical protein